MCNLKGLWPGVRSHSDLHRARIDRWLSDPQFHIPERTDAKAWDRVGNPVLLYNNEMFQPAVIFMHRLDSHVFTVDV